MNESLMAPIDKYKASIGRSPKCMVKNGISILNGDLEEEIYMNQPEGFIALGQEGKIDECLSLAKHDKMIKSTKDMLKSKFDMKDMGLADEENKKERREKKRKEEREGRSKREEAERKESRQERRGGSKEEMRKKEGEKEQDERKSDEEGEKARRKRARRKEERKGIRKREGEEEGRR
ncbi:hypothetical protein Tco_1447605 [Tanacetum coccineum]